MKIPKTVFVVIALGEPVSVWETKDDAKKFIERWGFGEAEVVKYKHLPKEKLSEDNQS